MKRKTAQNSRSEQRKAKPRGRPFPKGVSGNPGGRPKEEREVVEILRMHGVELARALLKVALKKKSPNVRAITEAFNRAYGKAKQVVELSGRDGQALEIDYTKLTVEQLHELKAILAGATSATTH